MSDIKNNTRNVWGASPAGTTSSKAKPKTKEFFEEAFKYRAEYEQPWLYEVVPFKDFKDKKVLEIGCGAGFDAYNITREGAIYTGIDITPENIERTRTHLGFFGLDGEILEADAENLPYTGGGEFDIVYSNGVLHHTPDMKKSFSEAYRILKNNGEFYVILYHKNSIFHWFTLFFVNHILLLGFLKMSFKERVARIEFTTSNDLPLVNVYSKQEVKNIMQEVGFEVESVKVRKLVKEDMPYLPIVREIWKLIPQKVYDSVGKYFGWYVIAKGIKRIEN